MNDDPLSTENEENLGSTDGFTFFQMFSNVFLDKEKETGYSN